MASSSENSLVVERGAARACREYHETVGHRFPDREERRASLGDFAERFYRERLGISPNPLERASFKALAEPKTIAVEIAHDGQLPHLGVVRMVLKAAELATLDGAGVALYLVGNHYSAEMRPDNIHFGMPLRGTPPSAVKHPPKLRMGKANVHKPFHWLDPPGPTELEALRGQLEDFIGHNLAHERKAGRTISEESRRTILARLDRLFILMNAATQDVKTLGDWIVRIQHDLLTMMLDEEAAARIVLLPMTDLTNLFSSELEQIAKSEGEVGRVKAETSAEQATTGLEPYSRRPDVSSFWVFCPSCGRRFRNPWSPGSSVDFRCPVCGHHETIRASEVWRWKMPDIVAYQVALFRLGIDGWVAGSRAPYHPVIRRLSQALFRVEPPPTFILTTVPVFRGLGDPPEGFKKTRLLRALLEMEPAAIAKSLGAPWDQDPQLTSEFLTD